MATLSTLRARVRNNVGGRGDKDSIIDTIINSAVSHIARRWRWNDLMDVDSSLSLASPNYMVTLPSTVRLVEKVKLKDSSGDYYTVYIRDRQTFRDLYSKVVPTDSGTPVDCFIMGRKIYFDRKADATYTVYLDVHKYPVEMTADGNSPSISGIDELIVATSTARLYLHLKQPEAAASWMALADTIAQDSLDEIIGSTVSQLEAW